jgi:hypothetical protein
LPLEALALSSKILTRILCLGQLLAQVMCRPKSLADIAHQCAQTRMPIEQVTLRTPFE